MSALTDRITEAQWQQRVADYASLRRLWWYHNPDSRRVVAGLPDLLVVGPGGAAWLELKSERGRIRPEQTDVIARLRNAGHHAGVYRPSDWDDVRALLDRLAGGDDA